MATAVSNCVSAFYNDDQTPAMVDRLPIFDVNPEAFSSFDVQKVGDNSRRFLNYGISLVFGKKEVFVTTSHGWGMNGTPIVDGKTLEVYAVFGDILVCSPTVEKCPPAGICPQSGVCKVRGVEYPFIAETGGYVSVVGPTLVSGDCGTPLVVDEKVVGVFNAYTPGKPKRFFLTFTEKVFNSIRDSQWSKMPSTAPIL